MADCAQKNGVELLELFQRAVGQDLAGALVALAGERGEAIVKMFARSPGRSAVRNTKLLAQEYLAEGSAQPWEGRFNHWLAY